MKSSFDQLYKTNPEKSITGVPFTVGVNKNNDPIVLYIAESNNERHEKAHLKKSKALERTRFNKAANHKIWAEIVADTILIKWEGVLDANGEPIEPTLENKTTMLVEYKSLFVDVLSFANDRNNFIDAEEADGEDETEKN